MSHSYGQVKVSRIDKLADRFVDQQIAYDPTLAYAKGLLTKDHSRFADKSPDAIQRLAAKEKDDLRQLLRYNLAQLTSQERPVYATLREQLESDLQLRKCRTELWDVDHFDGWQLQMEDVADRQPVETARERQQALQRWASLPHFVDVEISNLELGISHNYSSPQSVVSRVIRQMDDLTAGNVEKSPYFSPARRSRDAAFKTRFRQVILKQVNPALRRYRTFLADKYLPEARKGVAVSGLPDGAACYQAFLRANTTLSRTPQQVFVLGQKAVAANLAKVQKLGSERYGTSDPSAILKAIKSEPAEHFHDREDLLTFSQSFLGRSQKLTATLLISGMPKQELIIKPISALEEAAGGNSRFQSEPDVSKPAVYLIDLSNWQTVTRSEAEIATVHETVPGHHLQKAFAAEWQRPSALSKFVDNPAYTEGWARYAEGMAEECGIYDTGPDAVILRRMWPARGMVVDPGIHAFGWSRQQAIDYIVASGRFTPKEADDYVDRIAVAPGQLTSYDSGALEIVALRTEAKAKLGPSFDLKGFNQAVLEEGNVPLGELRSHIVDWIAASQLATQGEARMK